LLLNPPGKRPYLRDYYCSKVSKANYLYHPVDLTFQSALLADKHHVHVVDAIAERSNPKKTLDRIKTLNPDAILCLVGAVSWDEDLLFLEDLRQIYRGLIVVTGDVFLEDSEEITRRLPNTDAVLLDFASSGFLEWLEMPENTARDMIIRKGDEIVKGPRSNAGGEFSIGTPLYDLFPKWKYRYPFVRRRPFATILTDYGCPFPCAFCIMNAVGYRTRPVGEVMEELRWLKGAGYRELYINDQTFGAARKRTIEIVESMCREDLNFGWVCFTRSDLLDENLAQAMKEAGCHAVMFGVESADKQILELYRKGTDANSASKAMELCRRIGLRTVATFLLGFPEDNDATIEATIELALELDPDYASFNFAVPRRGTGIRRRAIEMGLADPETISMDQSGEKIAMPTATLSREEMAAWRSRALRRFYLRPWYLMRRVMALRTGYEAATAVLEGADVLKSALAL